MSLEILDESDVRRVVREELARPPLVHQRTVESVIGVPRRDYLSAASRKAFPVTKERRLVIAKTVDVLAYFELRLRTSTAAPANDEDPEGLAFARAGARRVR